MGPGFFIFMWGISTEKISDGKIFRLKNIPVEKISAVKSLGLDNYQFFMYHLVYLLHSEKTKKHKQMMKTIAVINYKGGVGKTTISMYLSSALVRFFNKRILLIDIDPQANATETLLPLGVDVKRIGTMRDFLNPDSDRTLESCIIPSRINGIDLVPNDPDILLIDERIHGDENIMVKLAEAIRKFDSLERVSTYDFCFIDCPPYISHYALMALLASDYYIVPLEADDSFSLNGVEILSFKVKDIKEVNKKLRLLGYVINKLDLRTKLGQMMPQIIRRQLRDKLFNTMIRISADIKASIAVRTPLFDFKPRSRAVYNFRDLAEEFLQRIEKNKGW